MVCIFPFAERIQEYMGNPRKHFAAKVNNRNARKKCEICSKLTKDLTRRMSLTTSVFLLLTLSMYLVCWEHGDVPPYWKLLVYSYNAPRRKISEFGVFSGPCFLVFLLGTGKYGPEKTLYSENFQAVINL